MELKPGEIICDKCQGSGKEEPKYTLEEKLRQPFCSKCHGVGKLDWIEAVVGKKEDWIHVEIERKFLTPKERKLKDNWTIEYDKSRYLFSEDLLNEIKTR